MARIAVAGRHDLAAVGKAYYHSGPDRLRSRMALDQTLNSSLNAVPAVSGSPLLLGLGVDQRKEFVRKSLTSAL